MLQTFQKWYPAKWELAKTDRNLFWLAWLLHLPLPVFLFYAIANGDWPNILGNSLAIAVSFAPRWIESRSQNRFPALGEFAIALTLFVETLGRTFHLYEEKANLQHLYEELWQYDTYAHGIEIGALVTFIVLLLYAFLLEHKVDYDSWFVILMGVAFGFALGGAWEIFEWTIDLLFDAGYQDGLNDTMVDILAGAVGAFIGSLAARSYRRRNGDKEVKEELPIFYEWF